LLQIFLAALRSKKSPSDLVAAPSKMAELEQLILDNSPATALSQDCARHKAHDSDYLSTAHQKNASSVISSEALNVSSRWLYATVLINVAVIALMTVVPFVGFYIRKPGVLSTEDRTLYVTGTTILASMIAALTSSQLRRLLLRKI
jgi:hypothetical protein